MFTAALNKMRDKQRFHGRAKRRADLERDLPSGIVEAATFFTPSVDAIGHETAEAVAAAFAELSPDFREVITLARVVQLPHTAIAVSMGRSEAAVRQLLVLALLRLATQLKRCGLVIE